MKRSLTLLLSAALFISACSKKNVNNPPTGPIQNTPSVSTFAGTGSPGAADGTKETASFNGPTGISINNDGFMVVADRQNNKIRIISPLGDVRTIAGIGTAGFSNKKDSVTFNFPSGAAGDAIGNIFVADQGNSAIRKITTLGVVSTFAGDGKTGSGNGADTNARFNLPAGIIADAKGNVYVADQGNNVIRKITPQGLVTTLAGSGLRGAVNATGIAASFNAPRALAVDSSGNVYVADEGNNLIRKITAQGLVTTVAGSGHPGAINGIGTAASFNGPAGIAIDKNGNLFVGDSNNNLIRKISTDGTVTTYAGSGSAGADNGALTTATFYSPQGIAVDPYGRVFIADAGNNDIRLINP